MVDLSGVFAPITTPFDRVTGNVDLIAMRRNVARLTSTSIRGLVLFGTTGEGPLLDDEERIAALAAVREVAPDRILLAGIAAESTRRAIRLVGAAAGAGADGVLVAPPSYFMPQLTPEALREHYAAVADLSPVPVLLYQVPTAYAGATLEPGLVAELANRANIAGIKDSTGDLRALGGLVESCPRDFAVLVGSGGILYAGLEIGARGGVLAVADLIPEACCDLYHSKSEGRDDEAGRLQEWLSILHREVVAAFGVPGIKAALDLLGQVGGPPRSPLRPLSAKQVEVVRRVLERGAGEVRGKR
jgi:4-hydroxy-2-oxoglutarate aldolase